MFAPFTTVYVFSRRSPVHCLLQSGTFTDNGSFDKPVPTPFIGKLVFQSQGLWNNWLVSRSLKRSLNTFILPYENESKLGYDRIGTIRHLKTGTIIDVYSEKFVLDTPGPKESHEPLKVEDLLSRIGKYRRSSEIESKFVEIEMSVEDYNTLRRWANFSVAPLNIMVNSIGLPTMVVVHRNNTMTSGQTKLLDPEQSPNR